MSSNDIAIHVSNLSKCYQIYDTPHDRLKQFIIPRLNSIVGKSPRQYFREFSALKDVSFEIKKGETVGIIGRNGSGKSTLLQIICGILNPTSGSVQTNGRIAALLELGSGFNPDFTGRENVYMNGAVLGLSNEEIDARFDDIAAFADIGEFIEQPVKTYSSGMLVRLAFSVNIMSQPEIMIVDEALAVGDMVFQAKCMTALRRIQDAGATVLFVSHDTGSIKSLCSRAVHLELGKLKNIGKAATIAENYIRSAREEMNTQSESEKFKKNDLVDNGGDDYPGNYNDLSLDKIEEFEKKVSQFRYGKGGAVIKYAELVDEINKPVISAEFNQEVKIRICFEAKEETDVSANYYIHDDKKNAILGAGLRTIGKPLIHCVPGEKYIVTYSTSLPLSEGSYSVHLELTRPIIADQSAEFLDVIDNAVIFQVQKRMNARIWAKVYIDNSVEIIKL